MQKLKNKSSDKLQKEFTSLRKKHWRQRIWIRVYFGCSTGNVSDEIIKDYIKDHADRDDDFDAEDD